jgi:excisionase family DNA binding protein
MEGVLTVEQAGEELGMHPASVRKAILAGRIHARRFGQRLLLITRAEVERYRVERRPPGRPRQPRCTGASDGR